MPLVVQPRQYVGRGAFLDVPAYGVGSAAKALVVNVAGTGYEYVSVALAAHAHAGEDITSGTIADARIAATITRDSEVMSIVLAGDGFGSGLDADLLRGVTPSAYFLTLADDADQATARNTLGLGTLATVNVPGATGQVISNQAGVLAGDAGFTYDPATDALTVAGRVVTGVIRPSANLEVQNAAGTAVITVDTTNRHVGIGVTPSARLSVRGQGAGFGDDTMIVENSAAARILTITGDGRFFVGSNNANNVVFSVDKSGAKTSGNIARFADATYEVILNTSSLATSNPNFSFGSNNFGNALEFKAPSNNGIFRIGGANTTIGQQSLASSPDKTLKVWNGASGGVTSCFVQAGDSQSTNEIFGVYANNGTTAYMSISSGNVGISTTAPTAALDIAASTTARASLRIRSGVAPTTPNEGDIWQDGTNIKMYIGGATKTFTLT